VTFVVLFILAAAWAVYLVNWARSRSEHRSVNSISSFNKHLSVLERTSPGRGSAPTRIAGPAPQRSTASLARPAFAPTPYRRSGVMTRTQARERRKNVLMGLAGAVMVTLVLAIGIGGPAIYLNLLADALLAAYVVVLVQMRRLAEERYTKVRYLAPTIDAYDGAEIDLTDGHPALLLQHSSAQ
jgi:hypothetical protein